jgi:periplasmic divalent cation tolerance protein
MKDSVLVALTTCADNAAATRLAREIVRSGQAACVNIVPSITSLYNWQGDLQEDQESLLVIKTTRAGFARIKQVIGQLHDYDVPELIGVEAVDGSTDYLDWVRSQGRRG